MKSFLLLTAFTGIHLFCFSQRIQWQLQAGTAHYVGELFFKESRLPEYDLSNVRFAMGAGLEYRLLRKVSLRAGLTYGTLHGDDRKLGNEPERNLNFTTSIWDITLAAQYFVLDPERYLFSPYVFAGISAFHFNPYTTDRQGNKVYLQPLGTEGQGIVPGREPYKLTQIALPYGAGMRWNVSDQFAIGAEISLRKTFTDYLDDVSTTYVDPELLLHHRGQTAVDMAYRGDELYPHQSYPAAGTERGISRFKDRYYFTTLTFSFGLGGGTGRTGKGMRCPSAW